MAAYSLINRETGEVVNVIEVEPAAIDFCGKNNSDVTPYIPPEGFLVMQGALPIKSFSGAIAKKNKNKSEMMEKAIGGAIKAREILDKIKPGKGNKT